jgi:hypothetical protein
MCAADKPARGLVERDAPVPAGREGDVPAGGDEDGE